LFKNKEIKLDSILDSVKRLSWHWLRFKARSIVYDINHWCLNPRACLGIVDRWGVYQACDIMCYITGCINIVFEYLPQWSDNYQSKYCQLCCCEASELEFLNFISRSDSRDWL
jgi:hypothetical protein